MLISLRKTNCARTKILCQNGINEQILQPKHDLFCPALLQHSKLNRIKMHDLLMDIIIKCLAAANTCLMQLHDK